jgi:hypothetical protein
VPRLEMKERLTYYLDFLAEGARAARHSA